MVMPGSFKLSRLAEGRVLTCSVGIDGILS